ncbi:MAG TPA: hypothetical protein VK911_17175, partial [Vicinamibacterales bacterium]|nr:hypothetical protein [Vicinamibacterales bacterium]
FAHPRSLDLPARREAIEGLALLLGSVLDARRRVMLEVNVSADRLEAVCRILPCMREPTIAPLHSGAGYALKAAVLRDELAAVIPRIKAAGGSDIVVTSPSNIVA